jgi:hypothetical protein
VRRVAAILPTLGSAAGGYVLLVRGALTIDLDLGRSIRLLGPITRTIAAPREIVFDVIARPYLDRTPKAMQAKLEVLDRGSNMVLAAHYTTVGRLTTTTLETVRFQRPHLIAFRLVRGPVPHVIETTNCAKARTAPSSSTRASSALTCGSSGNGGPTASRDPGNAPSRTRSIRSRAKPSDAPARPYHDDKPQVPVRTRRSRPRRDEPA